MGGSVGEVKQSNWKVLAKVLSVIFIFSSMFKDARELNVIEISLFVNRRLPVQLIHLLVCKPISHRCQQLSQVIFLNGAWKTQKEKSRILLGTLIVNFYTRSIFLKNIFIHLLLRERVREREKEGENHQSVARQMPPTGDLACNPGMCPNQESNP